MASFYEGPAHPDDDASSAPAYIQSAQESPFAGLDLDDFSYFAANDPLSQAALFSTEASPWFDSWQAGSIQSDGLAPSPPILAQTAAISHSVNLSLMSSPASSEATGPQPSGQIPYGALGLSAAKPPPKIGPRFSREALSVLKKWLASHADHPYPNEKEREILQRDTGLNKTQIANWLANARRRQPRARSKSSSRDYHSTLPLEIPQRPGTPAIERNTQYLNPMQRWFDSPPENEPATATAIARAIASKQFRSVSPCDDDSVDHARETTAYDAYHKSSAGTSRSSISSLSSAYSHGSRGTSGAVPAPDRSRQRRKRRSTRRVQNVRTALVAPLNRYQCTFCTETFRTKYDWQRHEKSLHLPLERWVCAPAGPRVVNVDMGTSHCVFCDQIDPDGRHIESHNPSSCQEKNFSRKDHLKQHLRLVHNAPLTEQMIHDWKVAMPEIRSRCGFCGITMDTWDFRVDHLADHFKMGQTMDDWKGDWGFDESVINIVENSIPPYLIGSERNTPAPFMASNAPMESPRHAYELLKSELTWFLQTFDQATGAFPNNEEIQLEACRILFAAEVMMMQETDATSAPTSWLRDLIISREDLATQAKFGPIRSQAESAMGVPKVYGKASLFEDCPLESQLRLFVQDHGGSNPDSLSDHELQAEASRIISRADEESPRSQYNFVANWLVTLLNSSTDWLQEFRERAKYPMDRIATGTGSHSTPVSFQESQEGISHGAEYMKSSRSPRQDFDHTINTRKGPREARASAVNGQTSMPVDPEIFDCAIHSGQSASFEPEARMRRQLDSAAPSNLSRKNPTSPDLTLDHRPSWVKTTLWFINDSNFHKWLARELGRWVMATMSPNNPNRHVPSDDELQHQARCIVYDDDDPWNPTAADNAEWLRRFKDEYGINDGANLEDTAQTLTNSGDKFD